jgi:hypothetical protein
MFCIDRMNGCGKSGGLSKSKEKELLVERKRG